MKKLCYILLGGLFLLLVSCLDKNSVSFKYLSEKDYGVSARIFIYSYEQFLDFTKEEQLLQTYNEDFFKNQDLIIFRFNTHYLESGINVINVTREQHDIYVDIGILSPANSKNVDFDQQITRVNVCIEVLKYVGDLNYEEDSVSILVINQNFKHTYRSIYYNCEK